MFAKVPVLDIMANAVTRLNEGKISVKKLDVDIGRIYSYNRYEGTRYGLGLYTNENWIRFLSVGAYFGYGINDKKWKYGGNLALTLNRSHDLKINYSYQNSLKETGFDLSDNSEIEVNQFLRNGIAYRFDHCLEHKLEGNYLIFRPLKFQLSLSVKDLSPLYDYSFQGENRSGYAADELRFAIRYAPGERYMLWGNHRMPLTTGNPVLHFAYVRGVDLVSGCLSCRLGETGA